MSNESDWPFPEWPFLPKELFELAWAYCEGLRNVLTPTIAASQDPESFRVYADILQLSVLTAVGQVMEDSRDRFLHAHLLATPRVFGVDDDAVTVDISTILKADGGRYPLEIYKLFKERITFPGSGVYVLYSVPDEEGSFKRMTLTRDARYKIGLSDIVASRRSDLECGNPFELSTCHVVETDDLKWCENWLRTRFKYNRVKREWHRLNSHELALLMQTRVLNKPRTIEEQRALLELQGEFERIASDGAEMFR